MQTIKDNTLFVSLPSHDLLGKPGIYWYDDPSMPVQHKINRYPMSLIIHVVKLVVPSLIDLIDLLDVPNDEDCQEAISYIGNHPNFVKEMIKEAADDMLLMPYDETNSEE